jgi:hypothetical protein
MHSHQQEKESKMNTVTTYEYDVRLPRPFAEDDFRTCKTLQEAEKEVSSHNSFITEHGHPECICTNKIVKREVLNSYANSLGYSDISPYEIVRIVSEKTLEIRAMDAVETEFWKNSKDWKAGGFAGHLANQRDQEWDITSNEKNGVFKIRWSEAKQRWQANNMKFNLNTKPLKHYDYNF